MSRNSKMMLRLYEISTGIVIAISIAVIWGWINGLENSFSSFSSLWFFLCFIISSALLWGRKLLQKPAAKVLSDDQRPPVLYLRSFRDDDLTSRPIREASMPISFTEEEYLVDVLKDFGPCIAIGQPGEKFPDLGAARMYIANDQWQDKVGELLISSNLVVLRAGRTQNFIWEVKHCIESIKPTIIIILIPRTENTYRRFHELANKYFPKPLPESIEETNHYSGIATLYGYLYFDEDWTPHFTKFEFQFPLSQWRIAHPIKSVIQNSLAPIYERFGIPVPEPENMSFSVVMISFLLSILCLYILSG